MKSAIRRFFAKIITYILSSAEYKEINSFDPKFKHLGSNPEISLPVIVKNPQYISVGENFKSLYNLRIEAWDNYLTGSFNPEIKIGDNVIINTDVHIGCINKVTIGNNVLIASRVYISDHSHGEINGISLALPPAKRELVSRGPVIIGDNVWIGEGVCILPGVTIGNSSIVGANAVVTKSVPPHSIVAGIPARIINQF